METTTEVAWDPESGVNSWEPIPAYTEYEVVRTVVSVTPRSYQSYGNGADAPETCTVTHYIRPIDS